MFEFDFNRLVKWLMPHFMFKPVHYAWLKALTYPLAWLHEQYLLTRQQNLYNATVNSQVIRLTRALRDKFGNEAIVILHLTDYLDQAFIYLELEGATLEFDYLAAENHTPVDYDFLQAEYDAEVDFIVRIPSVLSPQSEAIKAFVNKYKFTSKRYILELI